MVTDMEVPPPKTSLRWSDEEAMAVPRRTLLDRLRDEHWWTDARGQDHRITEMEPSHRRNTMAYLLRRAPDLARTATFIEGAQLTVTEAPDEVWSDYERDTDLALSDPAAWMRRQPVYRAMAAEEAKSRVPVRLRRLKDRTRNRLYRMGVRR